VSFSRKCSFAVPLSSEQREAILAVLRTFLAKRVENLDRLSLENLTFNVVALRASAAMYELENAESLLRYRLTQRLERGSVTALGTALQRIARVVGGSATGVEGADLMVVREGRNHYVQIKSGPEGFNKDTAQNIAGQLNSARARDPSSICIAGICYGRSDQVQAMVVAELAGRGIQLLVGREFWKFLSGDPGCMNELLELARVAAEEVPPGEKLSFADRIDRKLDQLVGAFEDRYGTDMTPEAWLSFLADNS